MVLRDMLGQVITFYSYKGGTGRSMALVNVACLLARGISLSSEETAPTKKRVIAKRVLAIDWDLEAPGLHSFFSDLVAAGPDGNKTLESGDGLIDFFLALNEATSGWNSDKKQERGTFFDLFDSLDFDHYLLKTKIPNLLLLKAGRFDESYAIRVNTFPWVAFFQRSPSLIPALAEYLANRFDCVLIDSRTGITDTSGICTMLLPEKLVVVFTPNRQSLTGIVQLVQRATDYRRQSGDSRPLVVFPLASRIEMARTGLLEQWRFGLETEGGGYQLQFESLFRKVYELSECDLTSYFDEVQIQHIPDYAYGEQIAVEVERSGSRLFLRRSYENFTRRLLSLTSPWENPEDVALQQEIEGLQARAEKALAQENTAQAQELLLRACDLHSSAPKVQSSDLAACLQQLAALLFKEGRFKEAEYLLQEALKVARRALGDKHPKLADYSDELGETIAQQGRFEEAVEHVENALKLRQQAMGKEHPSVAACYHHLANLMIRLGRFSESESFLRRSLRIRSEALGATDPQVAANMKDLADVLLRQGRLDEAGSLLQKALARQFRREESSPVTASLLQSLGQVLTQAGRTKEAESAFQRALEISQTLGGERPEVADSLDALAGLALQRGEFDRAQSFYERAQLVREKTLGPAHPDVIRSLNNLARLAVAQGEFERADVLYQRAESHAERVFGPEHPWSAHLMRELAGLYVTMERWDEAEVLYLRALEIYQNGGIANLAAVTRVELGDLMVRHGKVEGGIKLLTEALENFEDLHDLEGEADTYRRIGAIYQLFGQLELAEKTYRRAFYLNLKRKDIKAATIAVVELGWLLHLQARTPAEAEPRNFPETHAELHTALLACSRDFDPKVKDFAAAILAQLQEKNAEVTAAAEEALSSARREAAGEKRTKGMTTEKRIWRPSTMEDS